MPDTTTLMLAAYAFFTGGLMVYVIVLGIRRYLNEEKKKDRQKQDKSK
ncbi:MAG: hypothetical protein LWX83_06030 [Anaerolineae bacterium]|nr:hypothetical protein [Anaerolineae bacterium]